MKTVVLKYILSTGLIVSLWTLCSCRLPFSEKRMGDDFESETVYSVEADDQPVTDPDLEPVVAALPDTEKDEALKETAEADDEAPVASVSYEKRTGWFLWPVSSARKEEPLVEDDKLPEPVSAEKDNNEDDGSGFVQDASESDGAGDEIDSAMEEYAEDEEPEKTPRRWFLFGRRKAVVTNESPVVAEVVVDSATEEGAVEAEMLEGGDAPSEKKSWWWRRKRKAQVDSISDDRAAPAFDKEASPAETNSIEAVVFATNLVVEAVDEVSVAEEDGENEGDNGRRSFWRRLFSRRTDASDDPDETVSGEVFPDEDTVADVAVDRDESEGSQEMDVSEEVYAVQESESDADVVMPLVPVLRPGVSVKIRVSAGGRTEVDEPDRRVSAGGSITLPLLGAVQAEGLTLREFADRLQQRYADFLRDPLVDVEFNIDSKDSVAPWGYVTVLGRVKDPGRVNFPPTQDLTLSSAIQKAGGLDTSARLTGIKITREKAGISEQFDVNLQSVGEKGELHSDVRLLPGDVVFVPERVF